MTSSRSCSDGVSPAFSAASASAPIRRRNSTSLPRLRSIAHPNCARFARLSRATFSCVARLELPAVHRLELRPGGQLRAHHRARRGADDEVAPAQVDAGLGQPGEEADLPGDAGDPATAEHEGGALVAHRVILTDPDSTARVSWATLCAPPSDDERMRMTATQSGPPPPRAGRRDCPGRWTTRTAPVGSILRAAVRRWGDRHRLHRPRRGADLHRAGRAGARGRRVARRPRRRAGRRRRRAHPQLPAVPAALLRDPAGRGDLLPHQPAAAGARSRRPAHRRRRDGARSPGTRCCPSSAAPSTRPRCETVVVTGEAHILDFAARLELEDGDVDLADLLAGDPTDRQLDAGLDPATDLAHLAYTGGTTGVSKGVELPHRNVVTNVLQSACWTSGSLPELDEAGDVTLRQVLGEDEHPTRLGEARIVNLTPWFHAMGAIGYLNGLVMGGTTTVIHMRFDPVQVRRGRREAPGHLHRRRAAGLRRAAAGAGHRRRTTVPRPRRVQRRRPLPVSLIERLKRRCPTPSSARATG